LSGTLFSTATTNLYQQHVNTQALLVAHAASKATMCDVDRAQRQEAALNYLTGWFLLTQDHIRKCGGRYLPKGCLESIMKETTQAFGLDKFKFKKKTIYERARQHRLALTSLSSPSLMSSLPSRQLNNTITAAVSICTETNIPTNNPALSETTSSFAELDLPATTPVTVGLFEQPASQRLESRVTSTSKGVAYILESPVLPPAFLELPDQTVNQRLESCMVSLRKGSTDTMVVTGKELSASLRQIMEFLQIVVETKGRFGTQAQLPPILYVCGATGTGKTMAIHKCCCEVIENQKVLHAESPQIFHLNGSLLVNLTGKKAMAKTMETLSLSTKQLKRPANVDGPHKSAILLVLDEIDFLVGSRATEGYLCQLFLMAADANSLFALVCVSNSVDNAKARRLNDLGMVRPSFLFHYPLLFYFPTSLINNFSFLI
jgi:hypothetical protein